MNEFQDGKTYIGRSVGNISKIMPSDNIFTSDVLHFLLFHCVLSRFVIDGDVIIKEESNMRIQFL